jgi:hypothetical protein
VLRFIDSSLVGSHPPKMRQVLAATLFVAIAVAFVVTGAIAPPARASSLVPAAAGVSDDFAHDTALNTTLWQVNGPAATAFGNAVCGSCALLTLAPGFSSAGMEIAQANGSSEVGAIQSVQSFAPPLTVTAVVKGTVSNGHPFVFGIASSGAVAGVEITGNLDPHDCSDMQGCGNPSTCGTSSNSSVPSNQCYYGIYGRAGTTSGSWPKTPALNSSPSVGTVYTLQIAVDGSGNAQYSVTQGGQVLGTETTQVGTGPFYLMIAQSEGAPVPGPGPNQAYWTSVTLTPSATITPPPSSSSSSSPFPSSWIYIIVGVVVVVLLLIVLLVMVMRRRRFVVRVLDARARSPIPGADVLGEGPENLSGRTGKDGSVSFRGVKSGDYVLKAAAAGYAPSAPETVAVKAGTDRTVQLDPLAPTVPGSAGSPAAGAGAPSPAAGAAVPGGVPPPSEAAEPEDLEGLGGERIQRIARTFQAKGALSPETARTAEELGLSRMFVRIMKRRQGKTRVFVEVNGKYYLDEAALRERK